jgi:hypothetical protein
MTLPKKIFAAGLTLREKFAIATDDRHPTYKGKLV